MRHLVLVTVLAGTASASPQAAPAGDDFFEKSIRPVLVKRCFLCHGPQSPKAGGLQLDSLASVLLGGDNGPAIRPGDPGASRLIRAIQYEDDALKMPPNGRLPAPEIDALVAWVKMGAPWPGSSTAVAPAKKPTYEITEQARAHWAFQPPVKPPVPPVKNKDWPRSDIDRFLLARLEEKGLEPPPPASKHALLRRVTYDLHGLPPSQEEMNAFLADDSPEAFRKVVDRLLESPRYGERWGSHWLDVARYADSNGSDDNRIHGNAWRFRDFVIRSFNEDQPFDQFLTEQIAGDLMPASSQELRNRRWIATGFLVLGPKTRLQDDPAQLEMDIVDEQIDTVGRAFMGLTLGCARCHDHKFDPIPTADYYSLAGIFKSTRVVEKYDLRIHKSWTERALGSQEDEWKHEWLKYLVERANDQRRLSQESRSKYFEAKMKEIREELAKIPVAMAAFGATPENARVNIRGNPHSLGPEVPRQFPGVLAGEKQTPIGDGRSGRLELARWLTGAKHPLTARVLVNRVWKWHFGEGIVRSTDNFGRQGDRPDNQPLLDWLAVRFVEDGWSIKSLHRLVLLSSAYQMSGRYEAKAAVMDPEHRLPWRVRRRLSAEEIRDTLLTISGQLDYTVGGTLLPANLNYQRMTGGGDQAAQAAYRSHRRSVYLPVIRSGLYDMFEIFDFADPGVVTGTRPLSTVAPQALFMMNSEMIGSVSELTAAALLANAANDSERVRDAYLRAYSRAPSVRETDRALGFLQQYERTLLDGGASIEIARSKTWQALVRSLLSANEFIYLE
jgi:hypothetical protein